MPRPAGLVKTISEVGVNFLQYCFMKNQNEANQQENEKKKKKSS
jgi:hypothetical protein